MGGWTFLHALGPVSAVLAWTLAWIVYAARPHAAANRRLSLVLALEGSLGFTLGGSNLLNEWAGRTTDLPGTQELIYFLILAMLPAYAAFLATLETPVVRPLRGASGAVTLVVLGLAWPAYWFYAGGWSFGGPAWGWKGLGLGFILSGLYGLLGSLDALARARSRALRRRAKSYAVAFAVHDVIWIFAGLVATSTLKVPPLVNTAIFWGTPQVTTMLVLPLLAYGILTLQLFDIDLKVKFAVSKGTLGAIFVAVFFVVSKLAESLAGEVFGSRWMIGAVAAGLLLFALRPLERAANRLAEKALPGVEDTAAYAQFRKLEVYKAAVEELAVGGITAKERRALDALLGKLGIGAGDAAALEQDLAARSTVGRDTTRTA